MPWHSRPQAARLALLLGRDELQAYSVSLLRLPSAAFSPFYRCWDMGRRVQPCFRRCVRACSSALAATLLKRARGRRLIACRYADYAGPARGSSGRACYLISWRNRRVAAFSRRAPSATMRDGPGIAVATCRTASRNKRAARRRRRCGLPSRAHLQPALPKRTKHCRRATALYRSHSAR